MGSPTMLVLGHDADPTVTTSQTGTLGSWARDRGVRLVPRTMAAAGSGAATAAVDAPDRSAAGDLAGVDAVAVLGSAEGAWDDAVPWLAAEIALLADADRRGIPILGLCFGGQLLARVLGGRVGPSDQPEIGWYPVTSEDPEIAPGPWLEFHFDTFTTPPGARRLATSPVGDQAFRAGAHLGVQFHPEITSATFDTWARRWAGTPLEARLPAIGVDTAALRAEIERRAEESRCAGWALFDGFAARAGLPTRMLDRRGDPRTKESA